MFRSVFTCDLRHSLLFAACFPTPYIPDFDQLVPDKSSQEELEDLLEETFTNAPFSVGGYLRINVGKGSIIVRATANSEVRRIKNDCATFTGTAVPTSYLFVRLKMHAVSC